MTKKNKKLTYDDVRSAHLRIKDHIKKTPIFTSEELNERLNAQLFFKMENEQVIKAFKARGAFNAIMAYKERNGHFPKKIVAQSSGNHAQAVAYACKKFNIPALICIAANASAVKIQATKDLGPEVLLFEDRAQANKVSEEKQQEGYVLIHPFDNDDVICGQGTSALEALEEIGEVDAIFVPCGGGGFVSGTFLAAQGLSPNAKTFACEPLLANNVTRSLKENKIFEFKETPNTIADGTRTLHSSKRCMSYIRQMSGVFEITEDQIKFWQKELSNIVGKKIEPSSILPIASVQQFLIQNNHLKNPKILLMISGGNII